MALDRKEIAEAMDRGIRAYTADVVHFTDEHGVTQAERFIPICDFCLTRSEPIRWSYPCGFVAIEQNPIMNRSVTPWAACDACHALVEADDEDGLIERSLAQQLAITGVAIEDMPADVLDSVRASMRVHFARFAAARTGPALPEGTFDPETGAPLDDA